VIEEDGLQDNARLVGAALKEGLLDLQKRHPLIGDVRGIGLMLAIELVTDHRERTPATAQTAAVFEETRRQGIVVSKSGPFRSVLRMVPPLCLSMDDVSPVIEALDRSLMAGR
jgi:alanine-glyoxylate transaminase/(R)-3-amino-2-methylpropionate-pyruvate transaminase